MRTVNINLPASWKDLDQVELRFLLASIARHKDYKGNPQERLWAIQCECLLRWADITFVCRCGDGYIFRRRCPKDKKKRKKHEWNRPFRLTKNQIYELAVSLDWIKDIPEEPLRIESLGKFKAAQPDLSDLSMEDFMACENLWQGYAFTDNEECLEDMARILYHTDERTVIPDIFRLSVFYWFASVKRMFSTMFPDFFKSSPAGGENQAPSLDEMRRNNDTMIRALTKGDITKESEILGSLCLRALTELDALAREYREMQEKLKK